MSEDIQVPTEPAVPDKNEALKKAFGLIATNTHNLSQAARDLRAAAGQMSTDQLAGALGYQMVAAGGQNYQLVHNGQELVRLQDNGHRMREYSDLRQEMIKMIKSDITNAVDGLANAPVDAKTAFMDQRNYAPHEEHRINSLPTSMAVAAAVLDKYSEKRVTSGENKTADRQSLSQAKRDVRMLRDLAEKLGDSASLLIGHNEELADRQSMFASDAAADKSRDKKVAKYKEIIAQSRTTALEDETLGNPGYQRHRAEGLKRKKTVDSETPPELQSMLDKYSKKPTAEEMAANPELAARGDIQKV